MIMIITTDHITPHGIAAGMHDSEQQQMHLYQRGLLTQLEQSLDQAEALQSLELQRLRMMIERRQNQLQTRTSTSIFKPATISVCRGDIVIRPRRAA